MSVESLSPGYDQLSEIDKANEIFAWLQQPSEIPPELSETSRYRLEQLAGDTNILKVVGCIEGLDDTERIAVQLTIAGFDEDLVNELVDEELLRLAIQKTRAIIDPIIKPITTSTNSTEVSRRTTKPTPRTRAVKGIETDNKERMLGPDLFGMFLRDIGRTALLDAQTEVELAKAIEAGLYAEQLLKRRGLDTKAPRAIEATDEELEYLVQEGKAAKLRFIEANARLSVSIAKKYYYYSTELPDRSQIGMEGIIRAVEKFDYTKGYKFSTYATWWVKQAITRGEANEGSTIRLPVHTLEKLKAVNKLRSDMFRSFDEYPTEDELSRELGFDVRALLESAKAALGNKSLNELVGTDDTTEFGDLFVAYDENGYDDVEKSQLLESIQKALAELPLTENERRTVCLRFGLDDGKARTLDAIATELGVSRERIRQLETKALRKLRASSEFAQLVGGTLPAEVRNDDAAKVGVRQQERIALAEAMSAQQHLLTDEERYVARAFIEEKTQSAAAKRLGLTVVQVRESVRQTKAKLDV